ncbi:hypothetical protein BH20ACT1_BH20ACT1_14000 [soil metagenome]
MIPERVLAPFTEESFRNGLVVGVAALIVGLVAVGLWRKRRVQACSVAGLLLAAAGAAAVIQS